KQVTVIPGRWKKWCVNTCKFGTYIGIRKSNKLSFYQLLLHKKLQSIRFSRAIGYYFLVSYCSKSTTKITQGDVIKNRHRVILIIFIKSFQRKPQIGFRQKFKSCGIVCALQVIGIFIDQNPLRITKTQN